MRRVSKKGESMNKNTIKLRAVENTIRDAIKGGYEVNLTINGEYYEVSL
jgi:hypothetical protein